MDRNALAAFGQPLPTQRIVGSTTSAAAPPVWRYCRVCLREFVATFAVRSAALALAIGNPTKGKTSVEDAPSRIKNLRKRRADSGSFHDSFGFDANFFSQILGNVGRPVNGYASRDTLVS